MNRIILGAACAAVLLAPAAVFAQTDHRNLEEGLPATVEDAYPTGYLNRELRFVSRYDRVNGNDLFYVISTASPETGRGVFKSRFGWGRRIEPVAAMSA